MAEGATIAAYAWTITGPDFSAESSDQNPTFSPPKVGVYTVKLVITDSNGAQSEAAETTVTAAKYMGISNCSACHSGALPTVADKVTGWKETGHATFFSEEIDNGGSHYGENCIHCHTVGYDELANNGGFDDVQAEAGWVFPATIEEGNWETLETVYPKLANLANIQCESCHGPGSQHNGNPAGIAVSLDANTCGYCHDAMTHHVKNYEWDTSMHANPTAYPTGPGREGCVECHSGIGFVQTHDPDYADEEISTDAAPISCAVCHDPHNADNPHQVRAMGDVELGNGVVVSADEAGMGALCMNCHKSRQNASEYAVEYHSHFGPHHGPQSDLLKGTGGYEYEGVVYAAFSPHMKLTGDSCVSCHMSATPADAPSRSVGGHSFRMSAAAGLLENVTEDVENTAVCSACHGDVPSFNYLAKGDYDGDGEQEGIQDEIHGLLALVGKQLPPYGDEAFTVTEEYNTEELKAAYNCTFIEEDKSGGVHNPKYSVQLLQSSYHAMTGQDVPNADIIITWTTNVSDWSEM